LRWPSSGLLSGLLLLPLRVTLSLRWCNISDILR
jgi:hypothetical protein